MAKFEGLKEAVQEFNKWQGHATIMVDFSDNTAWRNAYASDQEWTEYDSDTIVKLVSKDNLSDRNEKYSYEKMEQLASAKKEKFDDEWELFELNDNMFFAKHFE